MAFDHSPEVFTAKISVVFSSPRNGVRRQVEDEASLQPERVRMSGGKDKQLLCGNLGTQALVSRPRRYDCHEGTFGGCRLCKSTPHTATIMEIFTQAIELGRPVHGDGLKLGACRVGHPIEAGVHCGGRIQVADDTFKGAGRKKDAGNA